MAKYSDTWIENLSSEEIQDLLKLLLQILNEIAETNRLIRLYVASPNKSQHVIDEVPIN